MTISYPLSFPTVKTPARVDWVARAVVSATRSPFSGMRQVQEFSGQWWEGVVHLPPMLRADAESFVAFLLSLNGMAGTFLFGDPANASPRGDVSGAIAVAGASQIGATLVVDGFVPLTQDVFKAGDLIQLGTGSGAHLHKILADVDSDSSGTASLDIWPRLRESPTDTDAVLYIGAQGLFALSTNDMSWSIGEASIYGLSFAIVEAL